MVFHKICGAAALSIVTVAVGAAYSSAQDKPKVQVEAQPQAQLQAQPQAQAQPAAQYRAKQVLGSKVSIEGDTSVGTVDDMVFDDNGQVEYLIVANQGKLVTVPWEAAKFNFDKRIATIDIAPAQYNKIPTYTTEQYPAFATPTYRTQTYQYYGLTPGQARRVNRALR